jgi:hypothetical protein
VTIVGPCAFVIAGILHICLLLGDGFFISLDILRIKLLLLLLSSSSSSTFNDNYKSITPSNLTSSDLLPTATISAAKVCRDIKRLRSSKCVGLDGIPSFIIKGCFDVFTPLLTFNLSVTSATFPYSWKQTALVPVFIKGDSTNVNNCGPISILNIFSKIFEFIVHNHSSNFF